MLGQEFNSCGATLLDTAICILSTIYLHISDLLTKCLLRLPYRLRFGLPSKAHSIRYYLPQSHRLRLSVKHTSYVLPLSQRFNMGLSYHRTAVLSSPFRDRQQSSSFPRL